MKTAFSILIVSLCLWFAPTSARAQYNYEPYSFSTFAGLADDAGSADGPAAAARFFHPTGVGLDRAGNIYVADLGNHTIRKITPSGVVSTVAGPGSFHVRGYADGTGSAVRFNHPSGVAVDSFGNVFVADMGNNVIRKITPNGLVSTFAGMYLQSGKADGVGSAARFAAPHGITIDAADNLYVADVALFNIRKITPAGQVTTIAGLAYNRGSADGTGTDARFDTPRGVAVDGAGNLYVADTDNETIRKIDRAGRVTTLAGLAGSSGSEDGTGSSARFERPHGVAVDPAGNVYVADWLGNTIRKITPGGVVTTVGGFAGDFSHGSTDGIGRVARFDTPKGVAVDSAGQLYVADYANSTIRLGVSSTAPTPTPTATPVQFFTAPKGVVNISTRLAVQTGENVLIGGFIITGNAPKKVIIRGIGPSLTAGGAALAGALQDPTLDVRDGAGVLLRSNDDWRSAQEQEIIDTTIPPSNDREAAIVATLNPGFYTAVVSGKQGGTGIGLMEFYDLGTASLDASSNAKLANISTRGRVQTNDGAMIGGFIVSGSAAKVIVRAIGPSLGEKGVGGALPDTTLDLRDGNASLIVANDDWRVGGQEQQIIDTTVPPSNDRESAVVATLNPGAYTAVVRGKNNSTGVALVEVYVLQ